MSDLRRRLEDRIAAGDDLLALRRVLEAFRDDGGTQDAVVVIFEEMRTEARDEGAGAWRNGTIGVLPVVTDEEKRMGSGRENEASLGQIRWNSDAGGRACCR